MDSSTTASSWIYFPTEESPSSKFMYTSMEIKMSLDLVTWERSTYSLLDYLGDLGGLFDALWYIARFIVKPFSAVTLYATMLTSFFRLHEKGPAKEDKTQDGSSDKSQEHELVQKKRHMVDELRAYKRIDYDPRCSFFKLRCSRTKRAKRIYRMVR